MPMNWHDDNYEVLKKTIEKYEELCRNWEQLFFEQQKTIKELRESNQSLMKSCDALTNLVTKYREILIQMDPDAFAQLPVDKTILN